MTVTKDELNKIAQQYHEKDELLDKHIEDACQYYTYNWIFEHLTGSKNILELGYGEGNITSELIKRGFNPTVIDGSDILLQKAKELYGEKINTVNCLFEEYAPDHLFDCVIATHVLEHVDEPVTLLEKMKNWLKKGGKLIIIVPNKESLHRQLAVIMGLQPALDTLGARDKLVGHQRVYSLPELIKDVETAGLAVTDTSGFFLKTLPNSMMLEYSAALIDALNKISPLIPKNLLANIGVLAEKG